ncbi:DUF3492 domain-containing protein [Streptomyces minutiscleroticus]|uniref:DUF3492 domain-containing protein n=1 Tax=Streptomyces minutiscleroticus TaxID=68238 RepID=UPI00167D8575|nr:DUF3492 domain-containing protein [Streptomyces minutiscleroticus]
MRIGLLTEGGYPYVSGDTGLWCDRLVRGLGQHEFRVHAFSRGREQEDEGWIPLPPQVHGVRTAPLWGDGTGGAALGRRARRRFAECYGELAAAVCAGTGATAAVITGTAGTAHTGTAHMGAGTGPAGAGTGAGAKAGAGATEEPSGLGEDGETCGCSGPSNPGPSHSAGPAGPAVPMDPVDRTDRGDVVTDRFASALYGLAELARDQGGLSAALRSETAVRALESACRAPGAPGTAREARVPDLLAVASGVERALRPLSLDWYEDDGLGAVDLCHATSGGAAALTGLLALHFAGVPLLVTEYGAGVRTQYLASRDATPAVRALLASFHTRLAAEAYRRAEIITPGNAHTRRWQERCGADRAKLRTIYPGMDASRFHEVGERTGAGPQTRPGTGRRPRPWPRPGADAGAPAGTAPGAARTGPGPEPRPTAEGDARADGRSPDDPAPDGRSPDDLLPSGLPPDGGAEPCGEPGTLVWVGRVEPTKDLIGLLHALTEVRWAVPGTGLRIVGAPADGPEGAEYLAHCKAVAAQLFPDEAAGAHAVGHNPVSFEEVGGPETPSLAEAYASGDVVVLSSVVEGFPVGLVEAMLCGRATVSTDVGAVVEVIGGTGLVVPPRNPRALAEACVALLRDPERRERLGAAARARALELFTVEQNVAAFQGIYLEIVSRAPVRRVAVDEAGEPLPFSVPAEAHVPGWWTGAAGRPRVVAAGGPRWAAHPPGPGTRPGAVRAAATEGAR